MKHDIRKLFIILLACGIICLVPFLAGASSSTDPFPYQITVPEGFEEVTLKTPDIQKWKKGSAEIFLVMGRQRTKSVNKLYKRLFDAAKKAKQFENVKESDVQGARAFQYTFEDKKGTEDVKILRLIAIAGSLIIHVDCSAAKKDFDGFKQEFETVIGSLKVSAAESSDNDRDNE